MDLFKKIEQVLSEGEDLTIVTRKKNNGHLVVSVLVSDNGLAAGSKANNIPPFILKGTPEELDEGFVAAIEQPLSEAVGLYVNVKSAKDAISKASAESSGKKTTETSKPAASKKNSSKKSGTTPKDEAAAVEEPLIPENAGDDENDGNETVLAEPVADVEATEETEVEAGSESAGNAPSETSEQPSAPEVEEVIVEDVNTLWARGKEFYSKGDYKNALRVFEQCRAVAREGQYATIDKAISNCASKLSDDLFN